MTTFTDCDGVEYIAVGRMPYQELRPGSVFAVALEGPVMKKLDNERPSRPSGNRVKDECVRQVLEMPVILLEPLKVGAEAEG